jgi:hypothetical protein
VEGSAVVPQQPILRKSAPLVIPTGAKRNGDHVLSEVEWGPAVLSPLLSIATVQPAWRGC